MKKKCSGCKEMKTIDLFSSNKSRYDGKSHYCKECSSKIKSKNKNLSIKSYMVDILRSSKRTAKIRGITEYSITIQDLLLLYDKQNGLCAITSVPMTNISGQGKILTNCSIDRIDSSKGYTLDNVQLTCLSINMMKLNATSEEFITFLNEVSENIIRKRDNNG